jgi:hypothetical protein
VPKIDDLAGVVFAGLSALVIEGLEDEDDLIRVMARTRDEPVPCPVCGALTGRVVDGYVSRTVTDVPVDGCRGGGVATGTTSGLPSAGMSSADVS